MPGVFDRDRGLLDRARELDTIAEMIDACRSASGRMLVIAGPAGIGKTSLLDACREAAGDEYRVLSAQGDAVTADAAFAVVRELLEPATREGTDAVWEGAAGLARLVFDRAEPERLDRDRAASVMYGLYWLIADLAERAPLALLIDDAHWLDAASARFISYLARRVESLALLLALSVRPGEGRGAEPLINASAEAGAAILWPAPLGPDAVGTIIGEIVGNDVDEALCEACHRVTGGNPFYVKELAMAVAAEPELGSSLRSGRVPAAGGITPSVATRLAGLGAECLALAQATAILGSGASLRSAASLGGLQREAAAHAADSLRAAGILAGERSLVFVHPVVAEATLEGIPSSRRAAMHAAAAEQLVASGLRTNEAAAHLLSAEPYGEAWVVDVLRSAARQALSQGAPEAASTYLRRALAEPPPPAQRLELLVALGRTETLLPEQAEFASLREALALAEGPAQRAELTLELGDALATVTALPAAHAVLGEILDHPEGVTPTLLVRAEASLIGSGFGDLTADGLGDRVARCLDRVAREEIDEPIMLAMLALAGAATGLPAETVASLARRALASDTLRAETWSAWAGALLALVMSDHSTDAVSAAHVGIVDAQRRGAVGLFVAVSWALAQAAFRTGDLSAAAAYSESALELIPEGHPSARWIRASHASVLIETGGGEDARQLVERFRELATDLSDVSDVSILAARGLSRVATGDRAEGVADLLAADRRMHAAGRRLSLTIDWTHAATESLVELGRRTEAELIAERELEAAIAFGSARAHGLALSVRGGLDPGPEGLRRLTDAVDILADAPARLEHARALVALGSAQLQRGRLTEARAALAAGLDIASSCGGVAVRDRARARLVAAGARPRRDARTGPDALTPAERRTAEMAIDGLTNRRIAQALFVSVKTVEGQLAAAYEKLGIHSRRELARALGGPDASDFR